MANSETGGRTEGQVQVLIKNLSWDPWPKQYYLMLQP